MSETLTHQISLEEAIELTTRYRNNPVADMPLSETFAKDSIGALIGQPSCHSFRIYLGRKADNSICSVLVAANAQGHDILPPPQANFTTAGDEGIILEDAIKCPPVCPPESPLNG
jgi:hypothetical protein